MTHTCAKDQCQKSRSAVDMGIPMEIPMGMGIGTVMTPHEPVWILWRFSDGCCEIKRKRVKHAINVIVAV